MDGLKMERNGFPYKNPCRKNLQKNKVMTIIKYGICLMLLSLLVPIPSVSQNIEIKCEVLDVGGPSISETIKPLNNTRYILLHHADVQEQMLLSKCLKRYNGKEIIFSIKGTSCRGIIYRLPHCFGRGLILYNDTIKVKKKSIIKICFPGWQ